MSKLTQIETEISQLNKRLAQLRNQKVYVKFLDSLDLQESDMQRTSDIEVYTELKQVTSSTDEYGYSVRCLLNVKYKYTIVNFITPTDIKTDVVDVEFTAKYSAEQTYQRRYDLDINCITQCTVHKGGTLLESMSDLAYSEEKLDYDRINGCYLHIVDAIYSKRTQEDDSYWLDYVKKLRK